MSNTKKLGRFSEPGHALTGDRSRRSRRVGWEFAHSIIDDCSRMAYTEIHDDERAATVTGFTTTLNWFYSDGTTVSAAGTPERRRPPGFQLPGQASKVSSSTPIRRRTSP